VRDPLAAFDDAHVAGVASEYDVGERRLRECLRRHQQQVRDLPGVEDIVYEWRRAFPWDPVVERRDEAYRLRVEPNVWPEFSNALGFDDAETAAVRAVHERHVPGSQGGDAMVLTRP